MYFWKRQLNGNAIQTITTKKGQFHSKSNFTTKLSTSNSKPQKIKIRLEIIRN